MCVCVFHISLCQTHIHKTTEFLESSLAICFKKRLVFLPFDPVSPLLGSYPKGKGEIWTNIYREPGRCSQDWEIAADCKPSCDTWSAAVAIVTAIK